MPDNNEVNIRLPANADAVRAVMMKKVIRLRPSTVNRIQEQADRTAWKLMQDWVEVQLSLIKLNQAEFLQVFLPYIWDGNRTFFTALKDNGFKHLQLTDRKSINES